MKNLIQISSFIDFLDNTEFHKIDGLILNAATKERKYDKNPDGIEQSLATNHMGSFLLVGLLLQKMLEQEWPSKIVFVGTDISARDKWGFSQFLYVN